MLVAAVLHERGVGVVVGEKERGDVGEGVVGELVVVIVGDGASAEGVGVEDAFAENSGGVEFLARP